MWFRFIPSAEGPAWRVDDCFLASEQLFTSTTVAWRLAPTRWKLLKVIRINVVIALWLVERLFGVRIVTEVPDLNVYFAVGVFHDCVFARLKRLDGPDLVQIAVDLLAENLHLLLLLDDLVGDRDHGQ